MPDALDRALADDWGGFQLQRTEPELIRDTGALRMDVKLSYKGRSWGTVQLEVAPAEGEAGQEIDRVPARPLDPVQIEGPERIACRDRCRVTSGTARDARSWRVRAWM